MTVTSSSGLSDDEISEMTAASNQFLADKKVDTIRAGALQEAQKALLALLEKGHAEATQKLGCALAKDREGGQGRDAREGKSKKPGKADKPDAAHDPKQAATALRKATVALEAARARSRRPGASRSWVTLAEDLSKAEMALRASGADFPERPPPRRRSHFSRSSRSRC